MANGNSVRSSRPLLSRLATSPSVHALVGILVVGGLLARWVSSIGGPAAFRGRFGLVAPFVTVPIHSIVAVTPFPSDVIAIANGTLYGFWPAVSLNWIGWWLAALAEFALGRRVRRDFDLDAHLARLPEWLRSFPVSHPVFLIGSRQVPWLGGHVATFVPGAMDVRFSRYVWCSAISILPGALVMAAIGVGLLRL